MSVYVQAKRWEGMSAALKFKSSRLHCVKGNVLGRESSSRTSKFPRDAREYVNAIDSKIVLIDGRQLAELYD